MEISEPRKNRFFSWAGDPPGGVPDPPEPGFQGVPESQSPRSQPGGVWFVKVSGYLPGGWGVWGPPDWFFVSTPPPGDLGPPRPGATVTDHDWPGFHKKFHQGPSRIATPRARLRGFRVNIQILKSIFLF